MHLQDLGVDLEREDEAEGFLEVNLEQESNTGLIEMKQTGLIQCVIEAVGLDDGVKKGTFTPSEQRPLVKDSDGKTPSGMFRYRSVVGMIIYLSGHNRLDIAFAVNCCNQYTFRPKIYHELALKRLVRYFKHTKDCGLVLDPHYDIFKVYTYPDADFSGMHGLENPDDPACTKSCTGFIMKFSDCPVLCISKLQSETVLSTMDSDIIALAHCCRELFPIIVITQSLRKEVGLPFRVTSMKVSTPVDCAHYAQNWALIPEDTSWTHHKHKGKKPS